MKRYVPAHRISTNFPNSNWAQDVTLQPFVRFYVAFCAITPILLIYCLVIISFRGYIPDAESIFGTTFSPKARSLFLYGGHVNSSRCQGAVIAAVVGDP